MRPCLPRAQSVTLTGLHGPLEPVRRLRTYFFTFRHAWTDTDMSPAIRNDPATGRKLFATRAPGPPRLVGRSRARATRLLPTRRSQLFRTPAGCCLQRRGAASLPRV